MYFLFALLTRVRGNVKLPLGSFSLLVYILHPVVIIAVRGASRFLGLWDVLVENSLGHYMAVCIGSAAGEYRYPLGLVADKAAQGLGYVPCLGRNRQLRTPAQR